VELSQLQQVSLQDLMQRLDFGFSDRLSYNLYKWGLISPQILF